MSLQAILPLPRSDVSYAPLQAFRHAPVFTATALMMAAMIPPTLVALALDPRLLNGVSVWIKPLKFELSLLLYLGTLAWFMAWLPAQERQARRFRLWAIVAAIAVAIEMAWIIGAAYFGIASHFNRDSAFMMAIYPVMGAVAVTLTLPSLVMGRAFLRHWRSSDNPAFALSIGLGLILTCVLTILVSGYMSNMPGHGVGGTGSDAGGVTLMGWSKSGGDLRVAHFFATHAMHFIPAVGFVAGRVLAPTQAKTAVLAFAVLFVGLVAYALVEAILGQPFLSLLLG